MRCNSPAQRPVRSTQELAEAAGGCGPGGLFQLQGLDVVTDCAGILPGAGDILSELRDVLQRRDLGKPGPVLGCQSRSKLIDFLLLNQPGGPVQIAGCARSGDDSATA